MGALNKLGLLIWKNFILQKRRPIGSIIELLLPILFAAFLIFIRNEIEIKRNDNSTIWKAFQVDHLPDYEQSVVPENRTWLVGYAPDTDFVRGVMEGCEKSFGVQKKTEAEKTCNFDRDQLVQDLKTMRSEMNLTVSKMKFTQVQRYVASIEAAKLGLDMNVYLFTKQKEYAKAFGAYLFQLQVCIFGVMFPRGTPGNDAGGKPGDGEGEKPSQSEQLNQFIKLLNKLPLNTKIKPIPFEDAGEFEKFSENESLLEELLAGVMFSGDLKVPSKQVKVSYRFHADPRNDPTDDRFSAVRNTWRTNLRFRQRPELGPREKDSIHGGRPAYYKEGFLALMHCVDLRLAEQLSNESYNATPDYLSMQRFPYPEYTEDLFILVIQRSLPLVIMLSFFYTAAIIVKSVVWEKEMRLKEYMMMMGLPGWIHWLAWYLKYIVFLIISCFFMSIIYKIPVSDVTGPILPHSDGTVVFVFLVIFSSSIITLGFLLSVLFDKASVAAAVGGIVYGLTYMPAFFIIERMERMTHTQLILLSFLSNVGMYNGCYLIGNFEAKGTGIQWYNLHLKSTVDFELTFLQVLLILILDSVIYMSLALYIQAVRPGAIGTALPWYFLFTKSYWTRGSVALQESNADFDHEDVVERDEFFEAEPANAKRVVEVKNLRKVYVTNGKVKKAVKGLNMSMYENEITVLLGHNGAGKTTTMAILTGFTSPTSGDAIVNGYSIRSDIHHVRQSMGLCPQFNILFDTLTVEEHIYFFSRLKGFNRQEAKDESKYMTKVLNLEDKGGTMSKNLSGGMKRKLSVGIALSANSKYVILDEPTSGMDPAARRAIWDLLDDYRSKCSMLLSTHFMDEADYLGNRISIMAEGKLRCSGSPLFLKNKFGVGYHIVLTKSEACDVNKLTDLFKQHEEYALLERISGAEVSFVLPFDSSPKFPALFTELDDRAGELGISGYGATITTMEEVFLRVTESSEDPVANVSHSMSRKRPFHFRRKEKLQDNPALAPPTTTNEHYSRNATRAVNTNVDGDGDIEMQDLDVPDLVLTKPMIYNTGNLLWRQQFFSLFLKHVIHTQRNYKISIAQVLVPVVFTLVAVINAKFPPVVIPNVSRELELDSYGYSNVLYEVNTNFKDTKDFAAAYAKQYDGSKQTPDELPSGTVMDFILDRKGSEFAEFTDKHLIAAKFAENESNIEATALFNAQGFHTSATSLQYIDQAYIRFRSKSNDFHLKVTNDPLPRPASLSISQAAFGSINGFFIAFDLVLGFSFLSSSFVVMYVKERADKAALLQRLTGVSPVLFWLSGFLWDCINFWIPCLICMIIFGVLSIEEYSSQVVIIFLIFANYIWASLPLVYCLSFYFDVPSTALVRLTIFNIISGVATILTISILDLLRITELKNVLRMIFLIVPQYCLGQSFADLYTNHALIEVCLESEFSKQVCEAQDIKYQENYLSFEEPGVGMPILFLFLMGCFYWFCLILIEYDIFNICYHKVHMCFSSSFPATVRQGEDMDEDEDVVTERKKINALTDLDTNTTYGLVVKELSKIYKAEGKKKGSLLAVDRLSFSVPPSDCFGLLGINGAGKTTTFKMLTGDHYPTSGTAYLDGNNLQHNLRHMQQRLGYCPQFDALIEQMTGEETLYMYARLRGVPERELDHCVKGLGQLLNFDQFLQVPCGTYSGGNKRKLSTAIALIGGPPVVLLDEPSSGMDPGARRMLWNAIAEVRRSGKSIIITSHSMEECEALCTRLAIMVNGQFRCIGNPQHLKSRFGEGFNLELSTIGLEVDIEILKYEISERYPGCTFKGGFNNTLSFDIPMEDVNGQPRGLARTFEIMEGLKTDFNLGRYTLTQTTLEQVFLRLVKQQRMLSNTTVNA